MHWPFSVSKSAATQFITLLSLCITSVSYLIRDVLNLVIIAPAIQLVLLIPIFRYALRISWLYAATVVSFGYLLYSTVQLTLLIVFEEKFLENYDQAYFLSILTAIAVFLIAFACIRIKAGFTFTPKYSKTRRHFTFIAIIILSVSAHTFLLLYTGEIYIKLIFIFFTIVAGVSLYLLLKYELKSMRSDLPK